ncbi:MAG: hypothetical protein PSX81_02630 [bacterium]|nr:hypothetical protein [bacterium]
MPNPNFLDFLKAGLEVAKAIKGNDENEKAYRIIQTIKNNATAEEIEALEKLFNDCSQRGLLKSINNNKT